MHEETAQEMVRQVFDVIEGATALGRNQTDIKGDLIALVQSGGKSVVERWAAAMSPYNADGTRNERRIKEAWEREYILAVANEDKSPGDDGWIRYPSPEANEILREPSVQAWITQESIGAGGQQLLPPGARRRLSKNEMIALRVLYPQIDPRSLMMNARDDPTDINKLHGKQYVVSWEEHMKRKQQGWKNTPRRY